MLRTLAPALALLLTGAAFAAPAADAPLLGFDAAGAAAERSLEDDFVSRLSAADQDAWLRHLSAEPHQLGSDRNAENTEYLRKLFESWGYDTKVRSYRVLMPTPKTRLLEMTAPEHFTASLTEAPVAGDPSTRDPKDLLPPYNAFSVDGDVEGELVFVNYGLEEDYDWLERNGIDVKGKIVIAKYLHSWRGIKPKIAAEHGAIGTIIYSDPADDGYGQGDVYPKGPWKNATGVQRGSVMDMPLRPGDVLTPGIAATDNAKRLKRKDVDVLTKIPVLPISYADAEPLLRALTGPVAPEEWFGQLPITYHVGPGAARVHLKVAFDWNMVEARDVIATMKGAVHPDQWVMRGNHHDAWNNGAADPLSGLVALLSEAKALGELAAAGHRPARTVVFGAWDGEEPGLIGSTEWVEDNAKTLDAKLVAYLNTDGNSRGFIGAGGSQTLQRFVNGLITDVADPQTSVPVGERLRARLRISDDPDDRDTAERAELPLRPLGSGSDYTPFLQHLGIASLNTGFGGEGNGGSYHTLYDTYAHYTRFRDPGLAYGVALSELNGRAVLRLANAPLLPFEFTGLADNVERYVDELEKLQETMRSDTARINGLVDDGSYRLALDPTKTLGPPEKKAEVPFLSLAPLQNAAAHLRKAADAYDALQLHSDALDARTLERVNELLYTSERLLTRKQGLPRRPWFRHFLYAPGFYTGYGVKTLPAVREAIEEREFDQVDADVALTAAALEDMADRIDALVALLAAKSSQAT